eukprot:3417170-Rhodomonas_salina.1
MAWYRLLGLPPTVRDIACRVLVADIGGAGGGEVGPRGLAQRAGLFPDPATTCILPRLTEQRTSRGARGEEEEGGREVMTSLAEALGNMLLWKLGRQQRARDAGHEDQEDEWEEEEDDDDDEEEEEGDAEEECGAEGEGGCGKGRRERGGGGVRGGVVVLRGLPGSGKSWLAQRLVLLHTRRHQRVKADGDGGIAGLFLLRATSRRSELVRRPIVCIIMM